MKRAKLPLAGDAACSASNALLSRVSVVLTELRLLCLSRRVGDFCFSDLEASGIP